MGKSYGFIEITGVVAAINALDIMCKTADVELASWERKLGGRLVTLIVQGDVSAVTAAVNAAVEQAIKKPASYAVIANPHEEIVKLVELSASRWKKKQQENPEIVYTEIKIFFASAAKQTKDLSRKNLKQQKGYNGYNGTDRNRQTIRFLYPVVLFCTVVKTLDRLAAL